MKTFTTPGVLALVTQGSQSTAEEPVSAVLVGLALLVVVVVGWWFARYARSVFRGDYRHSERGKPLWWIPGSGTHGGAGGQVPPLLPDSDKDEIR